HVVRNARTVSVRTSAGGGTSWVSAGRVVRIDPGREVAMIELAHPLGRPGDGLSFATQPARMGEPVDVIGYPDGRPQKTTTGTIRRVGMSITRTSDQGDSQRVNNVVQFSASVRPGSSGGPVIDSAGRVVAL